MVNSYTPASTNQSAILGTARAARDLTAGDLLSWARTQPVDRFGVGPSLAAFLAAHPNHNEALTTSVFFDLCLTGQWPGSKGA